jgi:hypothetical protein
VIAGPDLRVRLSLCPRRARADVRRKALDDLESEQFKTHFNEGRIIPIWHKDARPTVFDPTRGIGYLTFDPTADPRDEARRVAKVIKKKYNEEIAAMTGPPQLQLDFDSQV